MGRSRWGSRSGTVRQHRHEHDPDNLAIVGLATTFVMDAVGNITVKHQQGSNPLTMAYDAADRLVTSLDATVLTTYTYDDNGNMTSERTKSGVTSYSYDMENRITLVVDPTRTTSTYSADGLRRSLHAGGTLTTFVWDGDDYLQERT